MHHEEQVSCPPLHATAVWRAVARVAARDADKPETHEELDLNAMTMRELYVHFGLVPETHEFISHAMCLQLDEAHLDKPALPMRSSKNVKDTWDYREADKTCFFRKVAQKCSIVWAKAENTWLGKSFKKHGWAKAENLFKS